MLPRGSVLLFGKALGDISRISYRFFRWGLDSCGSALIAESKGGMTSLRIRLLSGQRVVAQSPSGFLKREPSTSAGNELLERICWMPI